MKTKLKLKNISKETLKNDANVSRLNTAVGGACLHCDDDCVAEGGGFECCRSIVCPKQF